MKKSVVPLFILYTFAITIVFWGICLLFAELGFYLYENSWLYIPYIIGGFSPAIASYQSLKKNRLVKDIKSWLMLMLPISGPLKHYLIIVFYAILYFVPLLIFSGVTKNYPISMILFFAPLLILTSGLTEGGWRYILQRSLDEKCGYLFSAVFTAIIWTIWHLPLLYLPGTELYQLNLGLYFMNILGLTFALGAMFKISNNIFLCVLFHGLINAVFTVFIIQQTLWGTVTGTVLLLVFSLRRIKIYDLKRKKRKTKRLFVQSKRAHQ